MKLNFNDHFYIDGMFDPGLYMESVNFDNCAFNKNSGTYAKVFYFSGVLGSFTMSDSKI